MNLMPLRIAQVVCLALCGCGRNAPVVEVDALPVTGKVTLDEKPLAGATVMFMIDDPPATFFGTTQADGTYSLRGRKELVEKLQGTCKVTISRMVKPDGSPLADGEMPATVQATEQLHPRYSMLNATELTANVVATGGTFNFSLTSN
jgi:hypothetical protein